MGTQMGLSDSTDTMGTDATVLFVDDETELLEIYEHLYGSTYDVRTAAGGEKALEKFGEHIDFAFFDRRMPEMSGEEAVRKLREEGYETPVGFISAVDHSVEIDVEHEAYLTKPIEQKKIHRTVNRHIP